MVVMGQRSTDRLGRIVLARHPRGVSSWDGDQAMSEMSLRVDDHGVPRTRHQTDAYGVDKVNGANGGLDLKPTGQTEQTLRHSPSPQLTWSSEYDVPRSIPFQQPSSIGREKDSNDIEHNLRKLRRARIRLSIRIARYREQFRIVQIERTNHADTVARLEREAQRTLLASEPLDAIRVNALVQAISRSHAVWMQSENHLEMMRRYMEEADRQLQTTERRVFSRFAPGEDLEDLDLLAELDVMNSTGSHPPTPTSAASTEPPLYEYPYESALEAYDNPILMDIDQFLAGLPGQVDEGDDEDENDDQEYPAAGGRTSIEFEPPTAPQIRQDVALAGDHLPTSTDDDLQDSLLAAEPQQERKRQYDLNPVIERAEGTLMPAKDDSSTTTLHQMLQLSTESWLEFSRFLEYGSQVLGSISQKLQQLSDRGLVELTRLLKRIPLDDLVALLDIDLDPNHHGRSFTTEKRQIPGSGLESRRQNSIHPSTELLTNIDSRFEDLKASVRPQDQKHLIHEMSMTDTPNNLGSGSDPGFLPSTQPTAISLRSVRSI